MRFCRLALSLLSVTCCGNILHADTQRALELNAQAIEECHRQHGLEADRLYSEAASIWSAAGDEFLPHLAMTLANQGKCRLDNNQWRAAQDVYREAVELSSRALGSDSAETAMMEGRLGAALAGNGHVAEAQPKLLHAVTLLRTLAPHSHELAQTLVDLAFLYSRSGDWDRAEPLAQEASALIERWSGSDSVEMALLCANLASLHAARRHPERAEPLYRKAHYLLERLAGPDDPRLATVLSQEAMLFLDNGKSALAEAQLTRALEMLRASRGDNSPDFAIAEANLATARMAVNRREQAVDLLEHAIQVERATHDEPTRELAIMERNLRNWRARKGR